MATENPPPNVEPPLCGCGCREPVKWKPGVGWYKFAGRGHALRGQPGSRKGMKASVETRQRMSESATKRWAGVRRRDQEDAPGLGVYSTKSYKDARKALAGQPCAVCGSSENVHAHHEIPGNDATLVPLCAKHHVHTHHPRANGAQPPPGAVPPLCACGCGQPVKWKRVRGWGVFLRGHGNAKVPAGSSSGKPPLCACGCKQPVTFRHGKGWNKYKRGHGQRVEGHYSQH